MDSLIEARLGADAALGVEWTELARLPAATGEDLNRVEAALALHLCCEPGRCAWLRSQPFLRLRMTALYFPHVSEAQPVTLFHQGLRVVLRSGVVTVSRQDPTAGSFLAALAEIAVEDSVLPRFEPAQAGPKRARLHR